MKARDANGDLISITEIMFPDGQPHVRLSGGSDYSSVKLEASIRSGNELLSLLLAADVLRHNGCKNIDLHVDYLLGGRMDRRIDAYQPFTLKVVTDILKDKFDNIFVLDPHSDVSCGLLDAEPVTSLDCVKVVVKDVLNWNPQDGVALCAPDSGALKKVEDIAQHLGGLQVVQCLKHRDMQTGKLSGFRLASQDRVPGKVLIVDDICDGGGTFAGVAEILKKNGAIWVGLYVTHGIFSKGFVIPNIDKIYTTRSYRGLDLPETIVVVPHEYL